MQYKGWNFEKTLLARSRWGPREKELIDVRIPVDERASGNLERDVRVLLKKDWNLLEREIPSQVYRIERHGGVATCRVAFVMDVPAGDYQRVGIYYDNPGVAGPEYQPPLEMTGTTLGGSIKTPLMTAGFDARSGQIKTLTRRVEVPSSDPLQIPILDRIQEHAAVLLAVKGSNGDYRCEHVSPANWEAPEITEDIRGPVFVQLRRRGRLAPPGCKHPERCPECEVVYRFFAHEPYFLVQTRLRFATDTEVFGVRVGGLSVGPDRYTHYTFRPVSPNLPETDVEEMGHVLIDPQHTGNMPTGPVLSGLLPYDVAWQGFLRTRKGLDGAVAAIQLRQAVSTAGGEFPYYRRGTYLLREAAGFCGTRAAVHVKVQRAENVVTVPAGTVIEHLDAVACDRFDMEWGNRTDGLGRRLNQPVEIAVHPQFMGGAVPAEALEPLPYGLRSDAYGRYGVR